jgi:hypothetical protein
MSASSHPAATTRRAARRAAWLVLLSGAVLGACGKKGNYVEHPDSGGAGRPPAMRQDMSATRQAPESTAGISRRTGKPGISGDTAGRSSETQSPSAGPGARKRP